MPSLPNRTLLLAALFFALPLATIAQAPAAHPAADAVDSEAWVRAHYTKYEFRIPMRDGVKVFVNAYVPQPGAFPEHGPYPFLMTRTPYSCGPYGEDQYPKSVTYSNELAGSGYIFVCGDVRGRYASEGTFVEMRPHIDKKNGPQDVDDASDMYDTVDYLLKHVPNNNGKVGITGISYPGFFTSASIIDSHPAIKAASPQAPMTDLFLGADDSYHGGAFMLAASYGFYSGFTPQKNPVAAGGPRGPRFDFGTTDMYEFYLRDNTANLTKLLENRGPSLLPDQINHTTLDSYWKPRNLSDHMLNVHTAVMTVGGWFDAEDLTGPLKTYNAIDRFNPKLGAMNTVVVGPWVHGGWARSDGDHLGDVTFNAKTGEFFRKDIQFPFFEHYLKDVPYGKAGEPLPKAYMFETGTNAWRKYDQWPPKGATAQMLYFGPNGKLTFSKPAGAEPTGNTAAGPAGGANGHGAGGSTQDSYVSDPMHPVPFTSYTSDTVPQRYMTDDQRFAARRNDVLVYTTEPLTEDVTVAGPISPKLHISSTATDSDFVVKLIDVYPFDYPNNDQVDAAQGKRILGAAPILMGGYQQLLRGEPFRAKFRNSWTDPSPLKPGEVTAINFTMPDINHTFRKGHRIMVQVQSSWFPLVDRNPQTFTNIPTATPDQFVKATETVYTAPETPSGIELTILPQR